MDNILDSFTRQGRKLKQRMKGKKNKSHKTGANTAVENVDSSSSLLRPDPRTAAGGLMEKGTGLAQIRDKSIRGTDPLGQSPCRLEGRRTTESGERQTLTKRKWARDPRAWSQSLRLWWEVGPVPLKSEGFLPLHPLRSCPVESRTVPEDVYFICSI